MTTRSMLGLSTLPLILAGAVLSAHAQTQSTTSQPPAAKDKQVIEASFAKADANTDGKLSKDEAAKLPAISTKFDELDKNKDGQLTLDEFSSAISK